MLADSISCSDQRLRCLLAFSKKDFNRYFDYHSMSWTSAFVVSAITFFRTMIGLISRPYETFRRVILDGSPKELVFLGLLLGVYFALASLLKVASFRPFLLTEQFIVLYGGAVSGVAISAGMLYMVGRILGSRATFQRLFIAWSYTILPTVFWFFATSVLYVIFPPPRTTSTLGTLFSFLFIVFSVTLLGWKMTLSYLVLRFGLKFDLKRNIVVAVVCAPVLAYWSVLMYRWGIFKVPFL